MRKDTHRRGPLYAIFFLAAMVLVSGCSLAGVSHRKEANEEKKIFGFIKGYNPRIKDAEDYLVNAGFNPGPRDGRMDKKTRGAVRAFQKANGFEVSGFIDSKTWTKLSSYRRENKVAASSAQLHRPGEARKIQQALKSAGFDPGPIDGKIGNKTKKAILDFQKSKGLAPSGKADQKTLEMLAKYFPK